MNEKYNKYIIKRELLSILYIKTKAVNILSRNFQFNSKKLNYKIINKYSQNAQFNILFGLFTKEERTRFSEYILKDLIQFIVK